MTVEEKEMVQDIVECEGFDYAFLHYSSYKSVKDREFHKLRNAYINATNALASYIDVDV